MGQLAAWAGPDLAVAQGPQPNQGDPMIFPIQAHGDPWGGPGHTPNNIFQYAIPYVGTVTGIQNIHDILENAENYWTLFWSPIGSI